MPISFERPHNILSIRVIYHRKSPPDTSGVTAVIGIPGDEASEVPLNGSLPQLLTKIVNTLKYRGSRYLLLSATGESLEQTDTLSLSAYLEANDADVTLARIDRRQEASIESSLSSGGLVSREMLINAISSGQICTNGLCLIANICAIEKLSQIQALNPKYQAKYTPDGSLNAVLTAMLLWQAPGIAYSGVTLVRHDSTLHPDDRLQSIKSAYKPHVNLATPAALLDDFALASPATTISSCTIRQLFESLTVRDQGFAVACQLPYSKHFPTRFIESLSITRERASWLLLSKCIASKNWTRAFDVFSSNRLAALPRENSTSNREKIHSICLVITQLHDGGTERVVALLANGLSSAGFDVHIITSKPAHEHDYELDSTVTRHYILDTGTDRYTNINRLLENQPMDLVVLVEYYNESAFSDLLFFKGEGTMVIFMEHNSFFALIHFDQLPTYRMRQDAYRIADRVTCLSESDEGIWHALGHSNVSFMPNPLTFAPEVVKPASEKTRNLLFVGRLAPEKGLAFLLEAIEIVVDTHPDICLLVVGATGSYEYQTIERIIQAKDLNRNVKFMGYTTDVGQYMSKAAIHLMPSRVEGYPMVLAEAMSFGVPTVLTRMDYLTLPIPNVTALVVEHGDAAGYAKSIIQLLEDSSLRTQMGAACRKRIQEYSTNHVIDRWLKMIAELQSNHGKAAKTQEPPPTADLLYALDRGIEDLIKLQHSRFIWGIDSRLQLPVARARAAGHTDIVICGAGPAARSLNMLAQAIGMHVRCFTDRNAAMHGSRIGTIPIVSLKEGLSHGLPIIIGSAVHVKSILNDIAECTESQSIPKEWIFHA